MATKITVALEDDLDGGPASETVRFGLGGVQYEIDLNKKNARVFRKRLTPFVEHARKAGPGQRRGPVGGPFRRCRLWPLGARVRPGSIRRLGPRHSPAPSPSPGAGGNAHALTPLGLAVDSGQQR